MSEQPPAPAPLPAPRTTIFSDDRKYRYTLWREFDELVATQQGYVVFIGVNPSTADETKNDPTIRKCIGFAKRWGYSALCMINLFGYRATDPKEMKAQKDPMGIDNDFHIVHAVANADRIIAAWGANGRHKDRDQQVIRLLQRNNLPFHCLRKTKGGFPEHPLYIPYEATPIAFP